MCISQQIENTRVAKKYFKNIFFWCTVWNPLLFRLKKPTPLNILTRDRTRFLRECNEDKLRFRFPFWELPAAYALAFAVIIFPLFILRPTLLIHEHLHLWRGKDNPSRTTSCLHHQYKCGTNSSVSCRALEGLCSKSWARLQSASEDNCLESCHNWIPFPGRKKTAAVRCDRVAEIFCRI